MEGTLHMARIQILELPTEVVGEFVKTPFVLVVDQVCLEKVENLGQTLFLEEVPSEMVEQLAKQVGAAGVITTQGTLDVVTP